MKPVPPVIAIRMADGKGSGRAKSTLSARPMAFGESARGDVRDARRERAVAAAAPDDAVDEAVRDVREIDEHEAGARGIEEEEAEQDRGVEEGGAEVELPASFEREALRPRERLV